jgi:tetratricopeptide (TPR) repeat protein
LDRQGRFDEAIERYRDAVAEHPDSPAAHNDLALCYARGGRLDESVETLARAVSLKPDNELYRNNLATVLVEMGRTDEALDQQMQVHSEAVAHYNLGYLLHQRGHDAQAADQFAAALRIDPKMRLAGDWLTRLGYRTPPTPSVAPPANAVLSDAPAASVPPSAATSPELPQRPAYPESWRSQAVGDGPVHLPVLQSPEQAVLPPTPDTIDRYYPTSAAPARAYAY